MAVFAENERSDLTQAERNELAKVTTAILRDYRRRR